MRLYLAYMGDRMDWVNRLISHITGGYAHVAIVFRGDRMEYYSDGWETPATNRGEIDGYVDRNGEARVYFESTIGRDEWTGKNGVRGPYAYQRVEDWYYAGRDSWASSWFLSGNPRQLELQEVTFIRPEMIPAVYAGCLAAVPKIRYARLQLLNNWLRVRVRLALANTSRDAWTCCEFPIRQFASVAPLETAALFQLGEYRFDDYVPQAPDVRRGPGVYEAVAG